MYVFIVYKLLMQRFFKNMYVFTVYKLLMQQFFKKHVFIYSMQIVNATVLERKCMNL